MPLLLLSFLSVLFKKFLTGAFSRDGACAAPGSGLLNIAGAGVADTAVVAGDVPAVPFAVDGDRGPIRDLGDDGAVQTWETAQIQVSAGCRNSSCAFGLRRRDERDPEIFCQRFQTPRLR